MNFKKIFRLKKVDSYLLGKFIGPLVLTFTIVTFIFTILLLWRYIGELVAKGVAGWDVAIISFYAVQNLIPQAMPLSILLASIMTYGNLGETYELSAFKSAGISLFRLMRPLFIFCTILAVATHIFYDYWTPVATYRLKEKFYKVTEGNIGLQIKEGTFAKNIPGISLRVSKRYPSEDISSLEEVFIRKSSTYNSDQESVISKTGELYKSDSLPQIILDLNNGIVYKEPLKGKNAKELKKQPLQQINFEKMTLFVDISNIVSSSYDKEEDAKNQHSLYNSNQLSIAIDSLLADKSSWTQNVSDINFTQIGIRNVSSKEKRKHYEQELKRINQEDITENIIPRSRETAMKNTLRAVQSFKNMIEGQSKTYGWKVKILARHQMEKIRRFSIPLACLLLFLVGAPAGAVVRKGGLGMPMLLSIIIFLIYQIIYIQGENYTSRGEMHYLLGTSLPFLVLLPIGLWLTYNSGNDTAIASLRNVRKFIKTGKIKTPKNIGKTIKTTFTKTYVWLDQQLEKLIEEDEEDEQN